MTATSIEPIARRRGLVAALQHSVPRNQFFAGLYLLACANGLVGRVLYSLTLEGWMGAATAVEMNVIVLAACYVGLYLVLHSDDQEQVRPADFIVAVPFLVLVALPIFPVSWMALAGLSLYILLFANNGSSGRTRGAIVLLALSVPMLWSRLVFQFFANIILDIDAALVASIMGTERVGNLVRFADDSGYMFISPACTSFGNISFAFLCWITVTQWVRHRWSPIDILWCLLACGSVIAVNVVRIAVTGLSQRNYELIHNQWGEAVGSLVIMAITIGVSVIGARREIFARS